jgi:hypothetical protein
MFVFIPARQVNSSLRLDPRELDPQGPRVVGRGQYQSVIADDGTEMVDHHPCVGRAEACPWPTNTSPREAADISPRGPCRFRAAWASVAGDFEGPSGQLGRALPGGTNLREELPQHGPAAAPFDRTAGAICFFADGAETSAARTFATI